MYIIMHLECTLSCTFYVHVACTLYVYYMYIKYYVAFVLVQRQAPIVPHEMGLSETLNMVNHTGILLRHIY